MILYVRGWNSQPTTLLPVASAQETILEKSSTSWLRNAVKDLLWMNSVTPLLAYGDEASFRFCAFQLRPVLYQQTNFANWDEACFSTVQRISTAL